MSIDQITNNESGSSVRTKLNEVITKANVSASEDYIDDKASLLSAEIDNIADGQLRGFIAYEDKTTMDADDTQDSGTVAKVMNDATASNNGYYRYDGTDWVKEAAFYATEVDPDDESEAITGKAVGGIINLKNRYQFYAQIHETYNDYKEVYIEENRGAAGGGNKMYFKAGTILKRVGESGSISWSALKTELGVSGTESVAGVSDCIELDSQKNFVYDISDSTFKLVARDNTNNLKQIVLLSNVDGRLVQPSLWLYYQERGQYEVLKKDYEANTNLNNKYQFYGSISNLTEGYKEFYIEENRGAAGGGNSIFIKGTDIYARNMSPNKSLSWSEFKTELGVSGVESPAGVTDCVEIEGQTNLVYSVSDNKFKFVGRGSIDVLNHIILLSNVDGRVVQPSPWGRYLISGQVDKNASDIANSELGLLPDYYQDEGAKTVTDSQSDQVDSLVLSLGIMSDSHNYSDHAKNINIVEKELSLDGVIHLGDLIDDTTKADALRLINATVKQLRRGVKGELLICRGNHDFNADADGFDQVISNTILDADWYAAVSRYFSNNVVTDDGNSTYTYGYVDFPRQKIRVICLDTSDLDASIPDPEDETLSKYNVLSNLGFRDKQINFLANALDLTGKPDTSDWGVVICSHSPLENDLFYNQASVIGQTYTNFQVVRDLLNAYRRGTAVDDDSADADHPYDVDVDYSGQGAMEIYCAISGHLHVDGQNYTNFGDASASDILCISILNSKKQEASWIPGAYDPQPPTRENGFSEDAWDIVSINPTERTVTLRRFGAYSGESDDDREFSFDAP